MKLCLKKISVYLYVCLILVLFFCSHLLAQPALIKWGEIPIEDLKMKSFPEDSNAAAIMLCDYGKAWFTGNFELVQERHVRIKILSESGYRWASPIIPFYSKDKRQRVEDIMGQTINLTKNGKVKKNMLNKKSIVREKIDNEWERINLTLPDLMPGSVIEYRYKIISENPSYLKIWYFQNSEPTRWSEFCVSIPENLEYATIFHGDSTFHITESEPYKQRVAIKVKSRVSEFDVSTSPGKSIFEINGITHRFVMKHIPALREQPFMTTVNDYRIKLQFQLSKIFTLSKSTRRTSLTPTIEPQFNNILDIDETIIILGKWRNLAKELMNSKKFGRQIQQYGTLREQTEHIVAGINEPISKMKAIYDYLRTTMKWNGEYRIYADQDLDQVVKTRQGDNAEISLIFISMLRDVGLTAHPVLISTRDHGKIQKELPVVDQFNHVLVYTETETNNYLLDATDPLRSYYLLPVAALNEDGWLVDENNPRWIKIEAPGKFNHQASMTATLNADGTITARLRSEDHEYSALSKRDALKNRNKEDFLHKEILANIANAQIDSLSILNKNATEKALITEVYFSTSDAARIEGESIYLNPMLVDRYKQNPFNFAQRSFPVDFAYPYDLSYTLNLIIPEEFVIKEYPKNYDVNLPNNSGKYSRFVKINGNNFILTDRIILSKYQFKPEEYLELREFYNHIVAVHAEEIVLTSHQ